MKASSLFLAGAALGFSLSAHATNGYFTHGYGVKSQGMGGVGIALPQDALSVASNPASAVWLGNRLDVGATWFRPIRETNISGSMDPSINGRYEANNTKNFVIPEFGYTRQLSDRLAFAITAHGHGGMNTDYDRPVPLLGSRDAGIDLAQLFLTPTLAWKFNDVHALGISVNLAYQRFKARGLQNFDNAMFSSAPGRVTNNGYDHSYGIGVQLGWQAQLNEQIMVGATWQSRTWMTEFDDYKGLFAENGGFDIPQSYGVGISYKPTGRWTLSTDVERINYSDVDSVGRLSLANLGNGLGNDNGAGFGWRDVTVFKLGASYKWSETLTLRAGYDHVSQPVRRSETLFNILAPGVVQDHVTLGATWTLPNEAELSIAYMHAFKNKVKGRDSIPPGFGGGEADLEMYQDSIGIAYGWQF